jgi:hypothetical protein
MRILCLKTHLHTNNHWEDGTEDKNLKHLRADCNIFCNFAITCFQNLTIQPIKIIYYGNDKKNSKNKN